MKKKRKKLKNASKFLLNAPELSLILSELVQASLSFKDNKNPDDQIEILQIQIHLTEAKWDC